MSQSIGPLRLLAPVLLLGVPSLGLFAATKPVPELPRAYVDTTWNPPVGGTTWNAHTGAQLSGDLAAAQPGDTIILDAGSVYTGNFVLPAKANPAHKWIYIQSSALSSLPGPGTRVGPSDAAHMPTLTTPNTSATITIAPGADHWRLVGLEITSASNYGCDPSGNPPLNCWSYYLIQATRGIISDPLADSITVDRCYVHGSDTQDVTHAVNIDGTNFAVIDSYVSDIHNSTWDSQAILAFYSPGPYKIVNNFLSATTEDVMLGGAGGADDPYVPSDIEIRRNHFFKPLKWQKCGALGTVPAGETLADGSVCPAGMNNQWVEKNNLEFKSGRRAIVTGNVLENTWLSGQTGSSVLFTVRTGQSGGLAVVDDITFRSNILTNVDKGISAIAFDDGCHPPSCNYAGESKRVWIDNNLFLLSPSLDGVAHNWAQLGPGLTDWIFQHNTMLMSDQSAMGGYVFEFDQQYGCTPPGSATHDIWVLDNAITRQPNGDCGFEGTSGLQTYIGDPAPLDPRYLGNAMFVPNGDRLYSFPAHNLATTTPFVYQNKGIGDYQLTTPNWTDTSDGAIAGIDWNSLQVAMQASHEVTVSDTLNLPISKLSGHGQASRNVLVGAPRVSGPTTLHPLTPCRVVDTRGGLGQLGGPALAPRATRNFDVADVCGIPAAAVAISANLTVTNVRASGELVVFPADVLRPNTSALSFRAGLTRANNALVYLSATTTTFSVFNNSAASVDFILDVNGHFQGQGQMPLKLATAQYNQGGYPAQHVSDFAQWMGTHFNLVISGAIDLTPYLDHLTWANYIDSEGASYPPQVYDFVHDVATSHGWNYESMFSHFNQDYQIAPNTTWSGLDQFDLFEQIGGGLGQGIGSPGNSEKGAFVFNGSGYTDVTVRIYNQTCGGTCAISNTLYLGYAEPFDLINLNLSTGRVGGTAVWQYWNGTSWVGLTARSDTTNGITTTGAISFDPPVAWRPTVVNGSKSKYWVRLIVTGATTPPTISKAYGDDWFSHAGSNNARGWNAGACQSTLVTMNTGIQYCQTPVATATARFRYQARGTGYWQHNYIVMNPSDFQGGQLTFPQHALAMWNAEKARYQLNRNGVFFDNGGGHISPISPPWNDNLTDLACAPGCQSGAWLEYAKTNFSALDATFKSALGNTFVVGVNGGTEFKGLVDRNGYELGYVSWQNGNAPFATVFDPYLPANNPSGTTVSVAGWDNQHWGFNLRAYPHIWDMGDRTPMNVLATYYMGANSNTVLLYNTLGWSYYDRDEYYYWSPTTSTLSLAVSPDTSGNVKTIHVTDGSAFAVPGPPLYTTNSDYTLQIGGQDVVRATKVNNTTFTTQTPVLNSYPGGTTVRFAQAGHFAYQSAPRYQDIWYYSNYYPAMSVDIGAPDPSGWQAGARGRYLTGSQSSNLPNCPVGNTVCADVWRRDFTNGILLDRMMYDNTLEAEFDTPSKAISLVDAQNKLFGPYYRLHSDGSTGPAITSIQLRGAEAAILLKAPR